MNIFNSIDKLCKFFKLNHIFKALGVNPSSFYYYKKHSSLSFKKKANFLQAVFHEYSLFNGIYGSGKIALALNKKGISCSKAKVSRAMRELEIMAISAKKFPKKKSKISEAEKAQIVNLVKSLDIVKCNQVWTTDITFIKTHSGMFYLVSFLDLFSRRIVAWDLCKDLKTNSILNVLDKARIVRRPDSGLIIHSDKGSQFRSLQYKLYLAKHHMLRSTTSIGHSCDENAFQESFHALLKRECVYHFFLNNFDDAYRVIFNYIEGFYNPIRSHSALGALSPIDFENSLFSSKSPSISSLNS